MAGRALISSHVDGVKLMGETDTEYKLMVALSVPKESLNSGVGDLIEKATLFPFFEVDTDIVNESLHNQLEMSPQKSIMIERKGYEPKIKPKTRRRK